ncbi:hypothetical protein [Maridesulfovibrio sp.]|uniref:hypothetical protein n=1 Tax=Maridesulfovibrio sp. TaxID=2795000 RepID=UPI0029F47379|nr:hypothetical protein [Maridesulfovibrio sp.]
MKRTITILIIILVLLLPAASFGADKQLATEFSKLSGVEESFKTLSMKIDEIAGADTKPDRVYAMQDLSCLCKTSKMQVHSLISLYSVVNLVKDESKFQSREADLLKRKCRYAYNDFSRRTAFVSDILTKAKDQNLRDLAFIFEAQLKIVLEQMKAINSRLK